MAVDGFDTGDDGKRIIVTWKDGKVNIDMQGFKGKACDKTKWLTNGFVTMDEEKKATYYDDDKAKPKPRVKMTT